MTNGVRQANVAGDNGPQGKHDERDGHRGRRIMRCMTVTVSRACRGDVRPMHVVAMRVRVSRFRRIVRIA